MRDQRVVTGEATSSAGRWRRSALLAAGLLAIAALTTQGQRLINRLRGAPIMEPSTSHSLRLMTWNIGKVYLRGDSRAADSDLEYVAAVIRSLNPHVIALQEIRDAGQLNRLVATLGPGWRGRLTADPWDRQAALVVRVHADFHPLPTSTGRIAQGGVITLPGGQQVAVISLHLDAFDPRRRLVQAEEIIAGARRLEQETIILAGDFNFDPAIAARGSVDHDLYRLLTRDFVDAARGAGATTFVSWRLDYVFYHGAQVARTTARVLHERRINIMDHDPLVVELSFHPAMPRTP